MFKYIMKLFFRGSGNLKRYLFMIAIFEATLLTLSTVPSGYVEVVSKLTPKPNFVVSYNGPGIEIYFAYVDVGGEEVLAISSKNLREATSFLIGNNIELKDVSIGCKVNNPIIRKYFGRGNVLKCVENLVDYSIILDWTLFQQMVKTPYKKLYLKSLQEEGVSVPSAWTFTKDLLLLVNHHHRIIYICFILVLSVSCSILGLKSAVDLRQVLILTKEMHMSFQKIFLCIFIVSLLATLAGMVVGYGLASVIAPLVLICLKYLLGIPYVYLIPVATTIDDVILLAFLSLGSYLSMVIWKTIVK